MIHILKTHACINVRALHLQVYVGVGEQVVGLGGSSLCVFLWYEDVTLYAS